MSIHALIVGRIHCAPVQRAARSGLLYATAIVCALPRKGNAIFVHAVAFEAIPANALLTLSEGDAVALAGELKPRVWIPKDGSEPRPSVELIVHRVLTEYDVAVPREPSNAPRT